MSISLESLVNFPGVKVVRTEVAEHEIVFHVTLAARGTACHRCGQLATEFYRTGDTLRLRHLPIFERPVYLHLQTRRYRCQQCTDGPTTTQHGDWYDQHAHCTKAFAHALLRALVNSTLTDVAAKEQVPYDVLRGLLERCAQSAVAWEQFDSLATLGLDEITLLKGQGDYVTLVSTRDAQGQIALLAVLPGREKATVKTFLASIPAHLRTTIKEVCTDLYEGFVNAVQETLPDAHVVADRFHVARLYRAALDELRKTEMRELKTSLPPELYAGLHGVLWALRRNLKDLTDEETKLLELLFECAPDLQRAYRLREQMTQIYATKQTPAQAQTALRAWLAQVRQSGLTCFDKFLGTLERHFEIITNYFTHRTNSGWVEGFNNKVKVLKRRCYGLTTPAGLFRRLWLDLNGLTVFAH